MKLLEIKIANFRGIKELTLPIERRPLTVLVGKNGAGKTAVLDCLSVLLSRALLGIRGGNVGGPSFSDDDITNGQNATVNRLSAAFEEKKVDWMLARARAAGFRVEPSDLEGLRAAVSDLRERLATGVVEAIPLFVFYRVNRAVLDIPQRIRTKHKFDQLAAYENALTKASTNFRLFFEWFREAEDFENERRLRSRTDFQHRPLEVVRNAIYALVPGFSNLWIERAPYRMMVTKKPGGNVAVNQLSDGEKCLLALAGDLARRLALANPKAPEPLKGTGIVLIDEVELHLHPGWQRQILLALQRTFPNCQFVVSTHSPQVLSEVKSEAIHILERTAEGVTRTQPTGAFGLDANRILEDVMDVPARPVEIRDRLRQLFALIDAGKLEDARRLRREIEKEIGPDEPEFARAETLIKRKEILGK